MLISRGPRKTAARIVVGRLVVLITYSPLGIPGWRDSHSWQYPVFFFHASLAGQQPLIKTHAERLHDTLTVVHRNLSLIHARLARAGCLPPDATRLETPVRADCPAHPDLQSDRSRCHQ